jgi:hypothetical protein
MQKCNTNDVWFLAKNDKTPKCAREEKRNN